MQELQRAILRARIARQTPQGKPQFISPPVIEPAPLPDPPPIPEMLMGPLNKVHKINRVINAACRHFGMMPHEILGPLKFADYVYPRQIAMYAARIFTQTSFPEIGRRFHRDHSTIHHAVEKIERLLTDDRVAADCEDLARAIGAVI